MKNKIETIVSQRLNKLERQNKRTDPNYLPKVKKYGREEPLFEFEVTEKNRYGISDNLIDVCTYTNESNYKFLKIWKLYQPTELSVNQYEYSKHGITIPIKDAKKMIKQLHDIFFPSK